MRRFASSLCLALLAFSFIGVSFVGAVRANPTERIKVAYGHAIPIINSAYGSLAVAKGLGFFAKEGLDVSIQTTGGSLDVIQNIVSGQFDIGAALPEAIVPIILRGRDLVMIYNYVRAPTGSVAVLKEGPIKSLKDLKGKKIGAQSLSSGNIMLTNAQLAEAGLNPKQDVTYLAVGVGAQALHALKTGQVDALALFDSHYAAMENIGAEFRYFDPNPDLFSIQFIVTREMLKKRPKLVEGFGRAMAKATYFMELNPEAAIRQTWKEFPSSRIAGMSEDKQMAADLNIVRRRMPLLLSGGAGTKVGWGSYNKASLENWLKFAVDADIIKQKPDVETLYDNSFVKFYNDWSREEIQELAKKTK